MKNITKFWLVCVLLSGLISTEAFAQSLKISKVIDPYFKDGEYHAQLYITNLIFAKRNITVKGFPDQILTDDESYFCVGINCYPPQIQEVTYSIGANTTDSLIAYLIPGPSQGTRSVRYEFSDADNPSDKVEHTFVFSVGTSVNETSTGNIASLSSPYPAPANQAATIQYSLPETSRGAIELYSADSRLLKTFPLSSTNSSLVIPTGEFASGSYFYALVIDGKTIATNRLVIAR